MSTALSLDLVTHELFVKQDDNSLKSHLISKENAAIIWEAVNEKRPFQVDGVGGFSYFQFHTLKPLTPERIKKLTTKRWLPGETSRSYFLDDDLTEVQDVTFKLYDPIEKIVVEEKTEQQTVKVWTKKERDRAKKLSEAIKNRHKSGKSFMEIYEEFQAKDGELD